MKLYLELLIGFVLILLSTFTLFSSDGKQNEILNDVLNALNSGNLDSFKQKYAEDSAIKELFSLPVDKTIPIEDRKKIIDFLSSFNKDYFLELCTKSIKNQDIEEEIKLHLMYCILFAIIERNSTINDIEADILTKAITESLPTVNSTVLTEAMSESIGIILNRNLYSKLADTKEKRASLIKDVLYKTGESILSRFPKLKVVNKKYLKDLIVSLSKDDPKVRMDAAIELRNATGKDFGFNPVGNQKSREEAINLWKEYIDKLPE